jgi:hypothetical protein
MAQEERSRAGRSRLLRFKLAVTGVFSCDKAHAVGLTERNGRHGGTVRASAGRGLKKYGRAAVGNASFIDVENGGWLQTPGGEANTTPEITQEIDPRVSII